jgi:ribosomal protein L37AE/L43A
MKCRKCNKGADEIGGYLQRVNETGVSGIWECRPSCDAEFSNGERVVAAIEGSDKQ